MFLRFIPKRVEVEGSTELYQSIKDEVASALRGDSVLGERTGDYMAKMDDTSKLDMDDCPPMYVNVLDYSAKSGNFPDRLADRMGIHLVEKSD